MTPDEYCLFLKTIDIYPRVEQAAILARMAFDFYIRKGFVPPEVRILQQAAAERPEGIKFNPYHDERGRFTFGPGGDDSDDSDNPPSTGPRGVRLVQEIPPVLEELPAETPDAAPLPGMNGNPLPKNPFDLLQQGYEDISDPAAAAAGHRTFRNPDTGDVLRFDEGEPDNPGYQGQDHYHRPNPDSTGKQDEYLDENGNPVPKGSKPSHLLPKEIA